MAWSVTSALVTSLVLALSLVPLLCLLLLKKNLPHEDNALVRACKRIYTPSLEWALHRPKAVLGIAVAALVGAGVVGSLLGSEFLPELDEGTVWVNTTLPPSVSPAEAQQMARRVRDQLRKVPEVATVVTKVGRPDDGTDPKIFNGLEAFVGFKPEGQWRQGMTKDKIIDAMDDVMGELPGLQTAFSQPIRDNVLESISQIDGQVVIKIKGDDLDKLNELATKMVTIARRTQGVGRAFIDREGQLPQVKIDISTPWGGCW
jgi:cobalt-zinc-cadmium resistance protein CzcA